MAFTLPRSITVDFSTDVDPQPIKAVQGDQTRVAKITLLNKSVPVNLTGLTVRAYVMPFGETVGLYEDVAVTDATAGKVEYSLSGNACVKAGDGVVNIQVTETATGKQAYTDEIPLKVKARKDFTGAIVGSTVFSALQTAIATALGLDAAAVHKAGEETITGLKSVPTPTAGAHITNKDYVDQNINFVKAGGPANAFGAMPYVGTAPIINSGSNANGNYTKFADGTMIQAQQYTYVADCATQWGGFYVQDEPNPAYPPIFPIEFYSLTKVFREISTASGNCFLVSCVSSGDTLARANKCQAGRGSAVLALSVTVNILAIGRWKA